MTFEQFHKDHPQYSYLVAKIHYNLQKEEQVRESTLLTNLVVQFASPAGDICESCSA